MEAKQFQGLVLGFIIGIALFVFLYLETGSLVSLILIPIGAVMGMAPQYLRPPEDSDGSSKRRGRREPQQNEGV